MLNRYFAAAIDDDAPPRTLSEENRLGEAMYVRIGTFVIAVITALIDLPPAFIVEAATIGAFGLYASVVVTASRFPSQYPEVFEAKVASSSKILSASLVRWTARLAAFVFVAVFVGLAAQTPVGLAGYALIIAIFAARWGFSDAGIVDERSDVEFDAPANE